MTKEEIGKHIEVLSDLRAKYSCFEESEEPYYEALSAGIKALKQEPRKGHWKLVQRGKAIDICCSNCKAVRIEEWAYNYTIDEYIDTFTKEDINKCFGSAEMRFCPNCGAKMVEPQESEVKE